MGCSPRPRVGGPRLAGGALGGAALQRMHEQAGQLAHQRCVSRLALPAHTGARLLPPLSDLTERSEKQAEEGDVDASMASVAQVRLWFAAFRSDASACTPAVTTLPLGMQQSCGPAAR